MRGVLLSSTLPLPRLSLSCLKLVSCRLAPYRAKLSHSRCHKAGRLLSTSRVIHTRSSSGYTPDMHRVSRTAHALRNGLGRRNVRYLHQTTVAGRSRVLPWIAAGGMVSAAVVSFRSTGQQSDIQRNLRLATLSHSNLFILTRQAHASRRRMHLRRSRSQKYRNTRVGRAAGSSLRDRWAPLLSSLRKWAGNICATQVYDVTDFLSRHRGGANVILQHAGGDATYCFSSSHRIPCLKLSQ
jgi:hypothetical protein